MDHESPEPVPRARVERGEAPSDGVEIRVLGRMHFHSAETTCNEIRSLVMDDAAAITLDLRGLEGIDGGSAALLCVLQGNLRAEGHDLSVQLPATEKVRELLDLYWGEYACTPLSAPPRIGILDHVGRFAMEIGAELHDALTFLGELAIALVNAVRRPSSVHWRDAWRTLERAGADGLGIVVLINLLMGLIMGFQAALQLRQYGAEVFVANLVGLAQVRELGPLMTAIIVSGRSGAAFAAELGTMRVSEEVDALRATGLCPYGFLVLPRVVALAIALPVLTLVADAIGIAGGLIVGVSILDFSASGYLSQTRLAVMPHDVTFGLLKSFVFAIAMALIACERGLATRGGAEGVGRATTSAVVAILFHLVLIDAIFAVLFNIFEG